MSVLDRPERSSPSPPPLSSAGRGESGAPKRENSLGAGRRERGLAAVCSVLLAGCTVGPDYRTPAAPDGARYSAAPLESPTVAAPTPGGAAQRLTLGGAPPRRWWTEFGAPQLDALVDAALRANPTVQAAQAALRQAQELALAQRGLSYPTLQASFAASRQKNAVAVVAPTLTSGAALFNLYTAQLSVGYVADIWGANRRQVESLEAQAEAERWTLVATYLTLTSNLVAAAIQEAALREQIAATEDVVRIEREILALVRGQFAIGALGRLDVAAQEAALAQVDATLPALQRQLAQQRDLLAVLSGHWPGDLTQASFRLDDLRLPEDLPVSLPARLVAQRPDVRIAEANLHAAAAQVGVATANLLPQITLDATDGSNATQLRNLMSAGTGWWNLAAGVVQPLFDGGTLRHRRRAAQAGFEQAAALYQGTVLVAVQNVADALHALAADARTLEATARAYAAATETLAIARDALRLGAVGTLAVLNAEQGVREGAIALAQARAARLTDTAALYQALGGDWSDAPHDPAQDGLHDLP